MKRLFCSELCSGPNHNVLIIARNGMYDCYVMKHDNDGGETPYFYMFGLPTKDYPFREAADIAVDNAPDYYWLCEEDESND